MKVIGRLILSAILVVVTGLLMAVASFAPDVIFSFYTDFSRQAMDAIASVTGKLPFPLWQWLLLVIVLMTFYDLFKHGKILAWLAGLVATVCTFVLVFTALWGLNYYAPPVETRVGLQVGSYSAQQLQQAAQYMAQQAALEADAVSRLEDGTVAADTQLWAQQVGEGYDVLAEQYPFFRAPREPVKVLLAGKAFSYAGFTGMFVPFTAEAGVNPETYPAALPFTMSHEAAHRLGVAREDEANFAAFLACIHHPDADFRYSGWYSAYIYIYNALYKVDKAAALEVKDSICPQLRQDVEKTNSHYAQYDSPVQEAAQKANDVYLKAAGDADGTQSYGKAADLLVAWYLKEIGN